MCSHVHAVLHRHHLYLWIVADACRSCIDTKLGIKRSPFFNVWAVILVWFQCDRNNTHRYTDPSVCAFNLHRFMVFGRLSGLTAKQPAQRCNGKIIDSTRKGLVNRTSPGSPFNICILLCLHVCVPIYSSFLVELLYFLGPHKGKIVQWCRHTGLHLTSRDTTPYCTFFCVTEMSIYS